MAPRKQTSSPLPQAQQPYEPGHAFSRSWNAPDPYQQQTIAYDRRAEKSIEYREMHEKQPLNSAYRTQIMSNYNSTQFNDFYHPQQGQVS